MRNLYCNTTDGCVSTSAEGVFNYTEEVFNCGIRDPKLCGTTSEEEVKALQHQREEDRKREREAAAKSHGAEKHAAGHPSTVVVDSNGFSDSRENSAWIENIA